MNCITAMTALLMVIAVPATARADGPAPPEQALLEAAYAGKLGAVQELVAAGVPVDVTDSDLRTPLMWAAFNGHTQVVGYLLDRSAALDARDGSGRSALMYASSGPFADTVKLLLSRGADVNLRGTLEGFTALMTAAAEGQIEVVRLLLDHGADPAVKDKDGDTAESFARQKDHKAVVELLKTPPARGKKEN